MQAAYTCLSLPMSLVSKSIVIKLFLIDTSDFFGLISLVFTGCSL